MRLAAVLLLLLVGQAWSVTTDLQGLGAPAAVGGPAGGGGAAVTTTTTTTTTLPQLVVPAAGPSDVNCPNTPPPHATAQNGLLGYANYTAQTCATGSKGGGYTVLSYSVWVTAANAGTHFRCSLYDTAATHTRIAAGCDSAEATLAANPAAFITVATTGSCPVAATTRYSIACAVSDASVTFGIDATTCSGCFGWISLVYPAGATAWPATLSGGGSYAETPAYYMTVQ